METEKIYNKIVAESKYEYIHNIHNVKQIILVVSFEIMVRKQDDRIRGRNYVIPQNRSGNRVFYKDETRTRE